MKRIILTGGGTAGHVTPNLALLPALRSRGFEVRYIGSYEGIEKELAEAAGLPYDGISSGKLRRYFNLKNFSDPFRVIKGLGQSVRLLRKYKPDVIFSKGGFVSVPVVFAASLLHIPAVIHESDLTPGLANKLSIPAARAVCCNFPDTLPYLPKDKAVVTGCPIRAELLSGSRLAALSFTGLSPERPVLLVVGGSLGSVVLNEAVRDILPELLKHFQVIHLCGKGHTRPELHADGYVQYEYISDELKDLFALADLVVSRAGANAICELLALQKPHLLVPLSAKASRGDQLLNAESFRKQGFSMVMQEEELTGERLLAELQTLYKQRDSFVQKMKESRQGRAVEVIADMLERYATEKN